MFRKDILASRYTIYRPGSQAGHLTQSPDSIRTIDYTAADHGLRHISKAQLCVFVMPINANSAIAMRIRHGTTRTKNLDSAEPSRPFKHPVTQPSLAVQLLFQQAIRQAIWPITVTHLDDRAVDYDVILASYYAFVECFNTLLVVRQRYPTDLASKIVD
ncbi:hypothetical protein CHU98_g3934 [Xylaria longipes]|nr:hypothetical protein CHU98_g3934 [Xylaria longipes]